MAQRAEAAWTTRNDESGKLARLDVPREEVDIERISTIITLHPGDMIVTGTSVGCGIVDRPPRLLNDGDVVECEIVGYPGCRNVIRIPAQRKG